MHVRSRLFAFWLFFPLYQLSEFFKNSLMKFNNITFSKFVLSSKNAYKWIFVRNLKSNGITVKIMNKKATKIVCLKKKTL